MTEWKRAVLNQVCGGCGHHIAKGQPMFVYRLSGVKAEKRRCVQCADEEPPVDLPPLAPRPEPTYRMEPIATAVRASFLDGKLRQLGSDQ